MDVWVRTSKVGGRYRCSIRQDERYARNVESYGEEGIAPRFVLEFEGGTARNIVAFRRPADRLGAQLREAIGDKTRTYAIRKEGNLNCQCDFSGHSFPQNGLRQPRRRN